jgi:hypothetical protein
MSRSRFSLTKSSGGSNPSSSEADEMGPNLEWGGTPYPYKTREMTFFFKPVEEKK